MLSGDTVVLFDVDNTLFDNDRFKADLAARLRRDLGEAASARYWQHYEAVRREHGFVDYLEALQRLRLEIEPTPQLLAMAGFVLDYPFAGNLYPDALAAIAHMARYGPTAIFSDGDIVFQPRKIERSGITAAVQGRVLISIHKERSLDLLRTRFPAAHYVMVDDKPLLLAAMKRALGATLTTVFVRQGHYATETDLSTLEPAPDHVVESIAGLCGLPPDWLPSPRGAATGAAAKELPQRQDAT